MDWKLLLTTFGLLFVAEIGDKTQLAVIALSSENNNPVTVFLGASAALILVTLIGVAVGQTLIHLVPQALLHKVAALSFVAIGSLLWFEVM